MTDTRAFEKMEIDGWGNPDIAAAYSSGFAEATRVVAGRLADAAGAEPGKYALDLCTGHGVVAAELLARGCNVTALDFSDAMLALARTTAPGATLVRGDAMALDFADGAYDCVTIGFGVPHFPDPARGLREAARVLRPGGRIAFSIWHGKGVEGAFGWLFDAVERLGDPTATLPPGPDAHMLADPAIAETLVTEAGFGGIRSETLDTRLKVPAPEALFDAFDKGAVRAASLLAGQSPERREAIRADLAARTRAAGVECDGGYLVNAPSVVVSATRR